MLTADQRKLFRIALGSKGDASPHSLADGIADEIDALHVAAPAADVPALADPSALSALSPVASSFSGANTGLSTANTYTDAAVNSAVNSAINAATAAVKSYLDVKAENSQADGMRSAVEGRLEAAEDKVNAILSSLKAAGLMS
jgi:hypothetical protein